MALPIFKDPNQNLMLMQTKWAGQLNPVLSNPSVSPLLLSGVRLANGVTVINHMLTYKMRGWRIVDIDGAATIYRSAPLNALTLTLTSSAAVNVSLEVF